MKTTPVDIYKKIPIYRDDTSDNVYIYKRKYGEGRINFPSVRECKKFIDNNIDDIKCSRNVVLGSSLHTSRTPVKASLSYGLSMFLQDVAQKCGPFEYKDCINKKWDEDSTRKLKNFQRRYNRAAEAQDEDKCKQIGIEMDRFLKSIPSNA